MSSAPGSPTCPASLCAASIGLAAVESARDLLLWSRPAPATASRLISVVRIALASQLAKGEQAYVRFRFETRRVGRLWSRKRFLLARNGAVVDLRVADVREIVHATADAASILERVIPIDRLFVFVIAPASLQQQTASPTLQYMWLLEGRDWEDYLGRVAYFFRRARKMVSSPMRRHCGQWSSMSGHGFRLRSELL